MVLYNIVLYSIRFTFTSRCIHSWASFSLWPSHLFLSGAISNCSPLFPSSILHTFQPGEAPFPVLYLFCLFILSMGFSRQEYWPGLPFPTPLDHVLSELFTMTHLSWVALSFTELCRPLHHDKAVIHEGDIYIYPLYKTFFTMTDFFKILSSYRHLRLAFITKSFLISFRFFSY